MFSMARRFTRPEKTDCRPSLKGRVDSTASCARRTCGGRPHSVAGSNVKSIHTFI